MPRRRNERLLVVAHVDALAEHGMPGLGEVNADLMRSSGLELTAQKSMATPPLDDRIASAREASAPKPLDAPVTTIIFFMILSLFF